MNLNEIGIKTAGKPSEIDFISFKLKLEWAINTFKRMLKKDKASSNDLVTVQCIIKVEDVMEVTKKWKK